MLPSRIPSPAKTHHTAQTIAMDQAEKERLQKEVQEQEMLIKGYYLTVSAD